MTQATCRKTSRAKSNNPHNTNKNICALAAVRYFGCQHQTRYLHTIKDVVYAVRKKYTVRSRGSNVKGMSVGGARATLAKLSDAITCGYIIQVQGHVVVLDARGKTVVDTAPRKTDKRKILSCYIVYLDLDKIKREVVR